MARFEKKLRELGFIPIDKRASIAVRAAGGTRIERKQLKHKRYRPWFTTTNVITLATDETGQSWQGPANTNLSFLGYENKSKEIQEELQTLRRGKFH